MFMIPDFFATFHDVSDPWQQMALGGQADDVGSPTWILQKTCLQVQWHIYDIMLHDILCNM